jgi:hypothetical protein
MAQGTRTLRKGELLAILGELYRDKETGTLVLQREEMNRFLYIQEGQIIFAASNAAEDKFTQILVDEGRLSQEQLEMAMEKKENRTIGRTLVEMGFLGSSDLLDALVAQLRKIAFSAMAWDSGMAVFKTGALPQNVARLPISTPRFLVDLALSIEDREVVSSSLGQLDAPIQVSPAEREVLRDLPPTPQEARLLEQIDGQRNVRQICERAGLDLFTGARFLLGLSHLGQVHVRQIISPSTSSKAAAEPMDLSFLDEKPAERRTATKAPPSAPPKAGVGEKSDAPEPGGLPFDSGKPQQPAEGFLLEEHAAEEMPTIRPSGSPAGDRQPKSGDTPSTLLPPPDREPVPAIGGPPPPRFLLEERKPSRAKRLLVTALVAIVLIGVGAASIWYFFLRDSEIISVPPVPAAQHTRKTPSPAAVQPPTDGIPSAAGAEAPPPTAPPSETANTSSSALSMTPAASTPASPQASAPEKAEPTPGAAESAQVSPPESPQAWDLLSAGRYAEAATAFRKAFKDRSGGYAINIEVACQDDTIAKGWAAASADKDFCVFPYSLKGRPCYLVLWGYYPDKPSAEDALKGLPVFFLQSAQPRVITWSKVMELTGTSP